MLAAVVACPAFSARVMACAACTGQSDSPMAHAMNAGIFSLMAVIVSVLAGAATFFVFLARKGATTAPAEQKNSPSQFES